MPLFAEIGEGCCAHGRRPEAVRSDVHCVVWCQRNRILCPSRCVGIKSYRYSFELTGWCIYIYFELHCIFFLLCRCCKRMHMRKWLSRLKFELVLRMHWCGLKNFKTKDDIKLLFTILPVLHIFVSIFPLSRICSYHICLVEKDFEFIIADMGTGNLFQRLSNLCIPSDFNNITTLICLEITKACIRVGAMDYGMAFKWSCYLTALGHFMIQMEFFTVDLFISCRIHIETLLPHKLYHSELKLIWKSLCQLTEFIRLWE